MILNGGKIYNSRIVFDDDSLKAIAEATGDTRARLPRRTATEAPFRGVERLLLYFVQPIMQSSHRKTPCPLRIQNKDYGQFACKGHGAALPKNVQIKEQPNRLATFRN